MQHQGRTLAERTNSLSLHTASRWDPHGQEKLPFKGVRVTVGPHGQEKLLLTVPIVGGGVGGVGDVGGVGFDLVGSCAENKSRTGIVNTSEATSYRLCVWTPVCEGIPMYVCFDLCSINFE